MMKKLIETWNMLGRSIYTGKRLNSNLRALTAISMFTAALGLVLVVFNLVTGQINMLIPSVVTLLGGVACALVSGVWKKREVAIWIPTVFCAVAFTYYTITGAADGTAILWSFLLPIGLGYFVSVKTGILLSAYYTILFAVLFYTPLRSFVSDYYSEAFMQRLPLLYAGLSGFTVIALVPYHRSVLLENEYAERLKAEVEKQTKVARERADRLAAISEEMVHTLAHVIDAKDKYTNGHSFRVSKYAVALAKKLGWSERDVAELRWEALMHDIGKIGVPDQVLNKPGALTPEELSVIRSHTTIGGDILSESAEFRSASETARYHHERWDGKGYPEGLAGEQIPIRARVVSIADAYDAMHSDRIYRKSLPPETIRRELERGRGSQFDPAFLDAFLQLLESDDPDALTDEEN